VVEWRPEVTERIEEDAAGEKQVTRALGQQGAGQGFGYGRGGRLDLAGANGILSVKMHDKVAALEKLARAFNMFKEQAAVNANLTPTIILTGRPDTPSASQARADGIELSPSACASVAGGRCYPEDLIAFCPFTPPPAT
jgi:hypothetical protein